MILVRGDWFYILLVAIAAFFMTRPYLYAIQQDNYRVGEIFKSRRLGFVYLIDWCAVAVFGGIWLLCYFLQARAFWGFVSVLFFFIAEFAMYFMEDLPGRKKPLRYTKRAVRCLIFVTLSSTAAVTAAFAVANAQVSSVYLRYLVLFGFPPAYPVLFMISASTINVFERLNNARYMRRTRKRLAAQQGLIKIAITGSFGKTSVKNYLHAMLAQKYNVLSTPESYNTPMGISKTVNGLDETYDVFIAEFGARRTGDIRTLMRMVRPQYAILTGINRQHLETFRTEDNIAREKCRILNLGESGLAVVGGGARQIVERNLEGKRNRPEVIYCDREDGYYADNVRLGQAGSAFDLVLAGKAYEVRTLLIGKHNIDDIVMAATLAYGMGVEVPFILDAIEKLEPVPHRMELLHGNGVTIIDDSFNSNPDGAAAALDTLALFDMRKVVLTPGLVELGGSEREENFKLGVHMGQVADLVLLVGAKRTDPIRRGLAESGFHGEIHIYDSLSDAEEDFKNRLRVGDALLILNDLPDIYDEKYIK